MAQQQLPELVYNNLQIGEELGSYEYVLTQEMVDEYRKSVDDPEGVFPTIAVKHDATALGMAYEDNTGGVNAGNEIELHNPPHPRQGHPRHRAHPRQVHPARQALPGHRGHRHRRGRPAHREDADLPDEKTRRGGKKWHPQG